MLPRKCSIKGCLKKHNARGLCTMHYHRLLRHGTTNETHSSKWHRLSQINKKRSIAVCSICGEVKIYPSIKKRGLTWKCSEKEKAYIRKNRMKYKYQGHKQSFCSLCGFVPQHKCQLDVDHMDGNHKNNDRINLRTVCANCHRYETYSRRQGFYATMNIS